MDRVADILNKRRLDAERSRDRRVRELMEKNPDLADLMKSKRAASAKLLSRALSADAREMAILKGEVDKFKKLEREKLEKLGINDDFFQADYFCKKCRDQGFVDGHSCTCREELLTRGRYMMSSISDRLKQENFENFNMELFRKSRQAGERISPYENMQEIRGLFEKEYVPFFKAGPPAATPNVYIYGPSGTGKSFFLNCLTKAILDSGYRVFYQTASELFDFLVSYSFTYESMIKDADREKKELIMDCDLLVIDDLGSEYINDKVISEFFYILNDRIIRQKPMIFSSNLALDELTDFYNNRIASRIRGDFLSYEFFGSDIRLSDARRRV